MFNFQDSFRLCNLAHGLDSVAQYEEESLHVEVGAIRRLFVQLLSRE
jgi:hypothetical protein